jgi:hypothetical protein
MDKAREKGEVIFWLDKKLKDIMEELQALKIEPDSKIYQSLLLLASRGNSEEILINLWREQCSLFPNEAPHPKAISVLIKAITDRFENSQMGVTILREASTRYGYSSHITSTASIVFRALDTGDDKTALTLIGSISVVPLKLVKSALRCAAQTGNLELLNFAWPHVEERISQHLPQLYVWKLYTFAKAKKLELLLDALVDSPQITLDELNQAHLIHISELMFTSAEEIDSAYYYAESLFSSGTKIPNAVLDLIITACGNIKDPERATETYASFSQFDLAPQLSSYNALMRAMMSCGEYSAVENIFTEVKEHFQPTTDTYECLTRTYLQTRDATALLEAISVSAAEGVVLPYPIYEAAIKGFIDQGRISAAQFIIRTMKKIQVDVNFIQQYLNNFPFKQS